MVIVPKSSEEPRRTADFKALNGTSVRQTHQTNSPFALASDFPRGTVMSVLDVYNAYHSFPIRAKDKDETTFITPWGRYCYLSAPRGAPGHLRAPQGYLASGDGFTHWDQLNSQAVKNKVTLVDDMAGMVMNSDKFLFIQETVSFYGMINQINYAFVMTEHM